MRPDLLELTPEALALLANLGLVKRAQKEIAAGAGPEVQEESDATVVGRFPDGVVSTLPPAKPLKDGICTCGATTICRHRLATVLVYVASFGAASAPRAADSPPPLPPEHSPSDEQLREYLGRRIYDKAVKLRARARARVDSESLVGLDTCSVRFLSGQRLDFARCDCRAAGPCEHLALALWALQGRLPAAEAPNLDMEALDMALELVSEVIEHGVSHLGLGLGSRFEEARRRLGRQRMVWPLVLLDEIEAELGFYRNRGGRYRVARLARCAASLWARRKVCQNDASEASTVLGLNLAPETSLRQQHLTGLGCRVERDQTRYYLADAASGKVLVLTLATGHRPSGMAPLDLASGQLITASAHRRANGVLRLGRGGHSLTSCGSWDHLATLFGPPPAQDVLLGECHLASEVRVLPIQAVLFGYYSPGQQELSLHVLGDQDLPVRLTLTHRTAAPFALECLWESRESLKAVAGVMERDLQGWSMRPTALLCQDGTRVPDLARAGTMEEVPLGQDTPGEDPLSLALVGARSCWHETLHRGLASNRVRVEQAAARLSQVGLQRTARQLTSARQADDWLSLAARLELAFQLTSR